MILFLPRDWDLIGDHFHTGNEIDLDAKLDGVRVTAYSNDWKNQTEGQSYRSVADARRNPVSPSEINRLRELYRTTLREALEAHSPKVGEVSLSGQ